MAALLSIALCSQAAGGAGRRLTQEAAPAATSKLSLGCDSLVRLAEPGDVYAHYNRAMSAAAVSTQIKAIEQRLGLTVGGHLSWPNCWSSS